MNPQRSPADTSVLRNNGHRLPPKVIVIVIVIAACFSCDTPYHFVLEIIILTPYNSFYSLEMFGHTAAAVVFKGFAGHNMHAKNKMFLSFSSVPT